MSRYGVIVTKPLPFWFVLKYLPLAQSRPEDDFGVKAGRGCAMGKDYNAALGAELDSLNTHRHDQGRNHHYCTHVPVLSWGWRC